MFFTCDKANFGRADIRALSRLGIMIDTVPTTKTIEAANANGVRYRRQNEPVFSGDVSACPLTSAALVSMTWR